MTNWLWFLAGLGLGLALTGSQHWTVNRLQPPAVTTTFIYIVTGLMLRLLLAGSFFLLALPHGLGPLLSALLGMWVMRWVYLGWMEFGHLREKDCSKLRKT